MNFSCPYCHDSAHQVRCGKNDSGSQRMLCRKCGCRYTPQPIHPGYPQAMHQEAVRLYLAGLSFRAIGRKLEVHHQTVINWITDYAHSLPRRDLVRRSVSSPRN